MRKRIPGSARTRERLHDLIEGRLGEGAGRSELIKLAARLIVEEALEAEVKDAIGREYYASGAAPGAGYRNGYRTGRLKTAEGRAASPSAGVIDSQSVKTTESGGPRGFYAGKKITGRKRHILTDTGGLLVAGIVHAAHVQDRDGAAPLLASIRSAFPWLRHVFADGSYAGAKLEAALDKLSRLRSSNEATT